MSGTLTYMPARKKTGNKGAAAIAVVEAAPPARRKRPAKDPAREAYAEAARTQAALERRNEMIIEYLPLVKFIASRIASRLPSHVEVGDLINSGIIGLIDALEKFDASRISRFEPIA